MQACWRIEQINVFLTIVKLKVAHGAKTEVIGFQNISRT